MWQIFSFCVALLLGASAFAADKNLGHEQKPERQIICEQLLAADLAGYYVVTDLSNQQAALIQLRPLGNSGSYTISTVRLNLNSGGLRNLEFERLPMGWLLDREEDRRVSVMIIDRSGPEMAFRFEDAQDDTSRSIIGVPSEDIDSVRGDILRPDAFELKMRNGTSRTVLFTRVNLDPALDASMGMNLKSLIASRLDTEDAGPMDYIFSVEMKRPMTNEEACKILANDNVCAFDKETKPGQLYYKFAVIQNVYHFLEDAPRWIRNWEVDRIDVMPLGAVSEGMATRLIERIKYVQAGTPPQAKSEAVPKPTSGLGLSGPAAAPESKPRSEEMKSPKLADQGSAVDLDNLRAAITGDFPVTPPAPAAGPSHVRPRAPLGPDLPKPEDKGESNKN